MKTDDLIGALAADAPTRGAPVSWTLAVAVAIGLCVSAALFLAILDPRSDFAATLGTWRYLFKLAVMLILAGAAARLAHDLALPGRETRSAALGLMLVPVLAVCAVAAELMLLPASEWPGAAVGFNATVCLTVVPLLSLPLLAGLLLALRHGAPTAPEATGAVAGLCAGGAAAFIYATHCPNDSPFYVAIWYTIAISLVATAGAVLGKYWLKW